MRLIAILLLLFCSVVARDVCRLFQAHAAVHPPRAAARAVKRVARLPFEPVIHAVARKHKVRPALVKSIVAVESGFNAKATSSRGAVGLMQVMPATAEKYGCNPRVPEENIEAGTRYLGELIQKYAQHPNGLSRAIAAYNAGPSTVDRYQGIPPFKETQGFVVRVLAHMKRFELEERRASI
jgi:soluble lytic murein transglycosylase-like protein